MISSLKPLLKYCLLFRGVPIVSDNRSFSQVDPHLCHAIMFTNVLKMHKMVEAQSQCKINFIITISSYDLKKSEKHQLWWHKLVGFVEGGGGKRITNSRPAWATHLAG